MSEPTTGGDAQLQAEVDDDDDDDEQLAEVSAAARQRGIEASQVLAVCADWACILGASAIQLLRLADRTSTTLAAQARCACFNGEGTQLLIGGDDKQVVLYDELPPGSAPRHRGTHNKKIGCVAFSPDGGTAIWADAFGEVHAVVLTETDAEPALVLGHLSPVSHLLFTPGGDALITADREGHVRSSHWPHAFVIECYYLWHTSPLLLCMPLASSPLVLSASSNGQEICLWRLHAGVLLSRTPASELLNGTGGVIAVDASAAPSAPTLDATSAAVACACEVPSERLIAFGFVGSSRIGFFTPVCEWDASAARLRPEPKLDCTLAQAHEPAALAHCSSAALLCVLLTGATAIALLPAAAGGGFNSAAALLVRFDVEPHVPIANEAAADADEAASSKRDGKRAKHGK